jgi:hypothetical protein
VWRKDGKEILFYAAGALWSIAVESAGPTLHFSPPQKLFSGLRLPAVSNTGVRPLAVSHDGSRIYFPQAAEQPNTDFIQIRMGWFNSEPKSQ